MAKFPHTFLFSGKVPKQGNRFSFRSFLYEKEKDVDYKDKSDQIAHL